ncbi:SDR family NAD(P)-dependent oxidoreductase [Amycolatopsis sp. CM201R]|nr:MULTISPECIES: SDR family NAD(P)-dependent oxidoreductase [unclassified Amycolatopsis]MDS0136277.1 SDR family NAD(P)-dependent oxidoreductase [Amycolatopsis sp. 505]MDS0145792.1 SDR family NAD(P)-dependent oxidoreductase [Amycolatopsis sp. CM201R]
MDNDAKLREYLKKVTADLRRARKRVQEVEDAGSAPVAIVGMACRFPGGVRSPEDLWRLVDSGGDGMSGFPADRGWPDAHDAGFVAEGGFVHDAGQFDAGFFGISPREALAMDPQQRLLLETSWEALERAGIVPETLRGSRSAVFVGAASQGYGTGAGEEAEAVAGHLMTGTATSVLSGRISYTLGLEGPSVTVDTACSSSLVALHLAVQSLRRGESDLALAGGAAVMVNPDMFTEMSRQGGLSGNGRCKAFADGADGTGWGEGAGMLLVERLADAQRLGHPVLAVIRGSAVNQDGASSGLSAPNGPSQQRVIRDALADARLSTVDVDLVEAHGTGTALGDPIEAQALLATYGQDRPEPLWLGSVKSNIGHTQAAAGVSGVIKLVMALRNRRMPPTLHAGTPSAKIDWTAGAVELLQEGREWTADRPRRGAVSSFGISGTNAHVILEEAAPAVASSGGSSGLVPWVLSAKSPEALRSQAARLSLVDSSPGDIAFSLATTRSSFAHRAVVVGADRERLLAGVRALADGTPAPHVVSGVAGSGKVAMVFPGQGAQWAGMADELLATSPVFAARYTECSRALEPYTGFSLLDSVEPDRVDVVQPALFAMMVSLAELWAAHGVRPDAVIGHSQGEIAAAVVSGALSLEDGARVVALRSKAILALSGAGGMVSVAASREQTESLVAPWGDRIGVAAVNGPSATVVSGEPGALDEFMAACEVRTRRIPVDYASHSVQVEQLRDELLEVLAPITPRAGHAGFFSTVTGEWLDGTALDAEYWYTNLRSTVRLDIAVEQLKSAGFGTFVEVSPHPVLVPAIGDDVTTLGSLRRGDGGPDRFALSVAEAHVNGVKVDWTPYFADAARVDLPTYAFQHRHYWLKPGTPAEAVADPGFWEAVDSGSLAETLGVDPDVPLSELLPALSDWRRTARDKSTVDSWRYDVRWRPAAEPVGALSGRWLAVAAPGQSSSIVDMLGCEVVLATGDRESLAARLREAGPVAGVVSLLGFDERPHPEFPELPSGVAGTLVLAQALGDAGIDAPLWLLTSGAVDTDSPSPAQAQIWGLGRVIGLEHPNRWGGLVDLPADPDVRAGERLAAILATSGDEDQFAVRSSGVLVRRLVRATPPRTAPGTWSLTGTVLVTGGTGALGPRIARWLRGVGAEHVILASRHGSQADPEPGVTFATCDVTDRAQVEALAEAHDIRAVIHAAALIELASIDATDVAAFAAVAKAKVQGAEVLDAVFDRDLDAFVLFSSIAGVWGSGDHAAYAAANAHLDALAQRRRARGLRATSLAWGVWNAPSPAKANQDFDASRLLRQGLPFLDSDLAFAGLRQVLADDDTFLAVADVDWARFAPVFTALRPRQLLDELPEVRRALAVEKPQVKTGWLTGVAPADRARAVLDLVRATAAAVLGHDGPDAVAPGVALRELGFDSLTAVELRNRLVAETGRSLPATLAFDHPTAERITEFLLGATRTETVVAVADDEPIAIVAMSCRYPGGVKSPEDLWDLITTGGDAITGFPADRGWDVDALYDPDPDHDGTSYTRHGGFLHDAGDFDPGFFGISPREALAMDPQQRLLLETSWEAMERAGLDPESLRGSATGVFVGTNYADYGIGLAQPDGSAGHLLTGGAASVVSGRISYTFGLTGPAVTVDTACSSSLVALHLACQSLRNGECTMALAGGVALMSTPASFVAFSRQRALAADGRCKAFSDDADGMGMAEGVGVLLVERLADAQRHGHEVLAVIRGSAVNQDGASNGLTAPNGPAQQQVIRQAVANARLTFDEVDAVEAHGTGTTLGDPIEAQALLATYGRDRANPLWLGSVKSNIGHSQAASGVAGVIKMVLSLRHGVLPGTLHAGTPSSHVDWTAGNVRLLDETREWPETGRPRRAAVSSFGMSGTNAHAVLEAAPEPVATESSGPVATGPVPWVLSAKTPASLAAQARRLRARVGAAQGVQAADVGYSLAKSRSTFERRAVVVAPDGHDPLGALAHDRAVPGLVRGSARRGGKVAFVFPGQGSQWVGMALDLMDTSPAFAARMRDCERALAPFAGWSLPDVLGDEAMLRRVDVVQPALFAVMVSLAELWRAHGVSPDAVIGHSQGEIAAAVVSGALSLEDGARVVALRSKAILALAGHGGMVSVAAPLTAVEPRLTGELSVAAVNGPAAVVVSGSLSALDALIESCAADGIRAKRVPVDYASHSVQVEAIETELRELLAPVSPRSSEIAFYSTVTAEPIDTAGLDGPYWYTNLRNPVLFDATTRQLAADGYDTFIECSPHPVLTMSVEDTVDEAVVTGTLRRGDGGLDRLYTSFAEAWVLGVDVDWTPTFGEGARLIPLPTYAFDHQRYWLDPAPATPAEDGLWTALEETDDLAGLLGVDQGALDEVLPALTRWRSQRSTVDSWCLKIGWVPVAEPALPLLSGRWLALVPAGPDRSAVLDALASRGADVVTASPEELPPGEYAGVVSLLGLDETSLPGHPLLATGVAATAALAPALAAAGIDAPLWLLTRGAVATGPGDAPASSVPAQLWGLGRVIGLEYPGLWGGLIDLPAAFDERAADRLAGLLAEPGGEDQLALRDHGILARRLRPARPAPAGEPWRPRGTVLVTGGTGALGAHVARWLGRSGADHLVLTSRRGEAAPGAAELAEELRGYGCAVTIAACDVAERKAVEALLDSLGHPPVAVVHAAGLPQSSTLAETGLDEFEDVLAAKVAGAAHLDALLGDDLEAFVLFSSNSGVWGSAGQGAYAAANAYLDALAEQRRARGAKATSVAWGLWAGGGMASDDGEQQLRRRGLRPMAPERAVAALQGALDRDETFLAVADVDWDRFVPAFTASRRRPLIEELPAVRRVLDQLEAEQERHDEGAAGWRERLAGLPEAERDRAVLDLVRTEAAAVLGHRGADAIGSTRPFRDLGFDSVTAVEVRNRLRQATGLRLAATAVFDHPTPIALARFLAAGIAPGGTPADSAFGALDRLEASLTDLGEPDENVRMRVEMRLKSLLSRWSGDHAAPRQAQLADASAAEVFAFIDNELGVSPPPAH